MTKTGDQGSGFRVQRKASRVLTSAICILISVYKYTFAYFLGGQCRFTPSCSAYAIEAIELHGPLKGARLAASRICRCHPWGGHGYDPVQKAGMGDAHREAFPDC